MIPIYAYFVSGAQIYRFHSVQIKQRAFTKSNNTNSLTLHTHTALNILECTYLLNIMSHGAYTSCRDHDERLHSRKNYERCKLNRRAENKNNFFIIEYESRCNSPLKLWHGTYWHTHRQSYQLICVHSIAYRSNMQYAAVSSQSFEF